MKRKVTQHYWVLCVRLCGSDERKTCRQPQRRCYGYSVIRLHAVENCCAECEWIDTIVHKECFNQHIICNRLNVAPIRFVVAEKVLYCLLPMLIHIVIVLTRYEFIKNWGTYPPLCTSNQLEAVTGTTSATFKIPGIPYTLPVEAEAIQWQQHKWNGIQS